MKFHYWNQFWMKEEFRQFTNVYALLNSSLSVARKSMFSHSLVLDGVFDVFQWPFHNEVRQDERRIWRWSAPDPVIPKITRLHFVWLLLVGSHHPLGVRFTDAEQYRSLRAHIIAAKNMIKSYIIFKEPRILSHILAMFKEWTEIRWLWKYTNEKKESWKAQIWMDGWYAGGYQRTKDYYLVVSC